MIKRLLQTILLIAVCFIAIGSANAQLSQEIKNAYSLKSLGGEGYVFTDAVNYQGYIYAVQLYKKDGGGTNTVRVVRMNQDNDRFGTLSFSGYYRELTAGGIYQYAEMVVWQDCLVVFWRNQTNGEIRQRRFRLGNNGDLESLDGGDAKMTNSQGLYGKFAVTVFRNELYLIAGMRYNQRIQVQKTSATSPGEGDWTFVNSVGKEANGVHDAGGVDGLESGYYGPDDTWDAITWYGERNGEATSRLVLVRMKNGWAEGYQYDGKAWIPRAEESVNIKSTFSMKLVQGSIEGASDMGTNPVQCIFASNDPKNTGEVFIKEYRPSSHTFGKFWRTDIPYAWFGVTSGIINDQTNSDRTDFYRQIIYIISANNPGKHGSWGGNYATSLRSNVVAVKKTMFQTTAEHLNNPEFRKLITLVGVMEGPPPTVIDNKQWFDNQSGDITSIILGTTKEKAIASTQSINSETSIAIGPNDDKFTLQSNIGLAFEKTTSSIATTSLYMEDIYKNNNVVKQQKGYLFYSAPLMKRFEATFYEPSTNADNVNNEKQRVKGMSLICNIMQGGAYLFSKELSLTEAPFMIKEPNNIESWHDREAQVDANGNKREYAEAAYLLNFKFDEGDHSGKLTTTATNQETSEQKVSSGMNVKIPFFEMENKQTITFNKQVTNTIGHNVEAKLETIDRSKVITSKPSVASAYTCEILLLDETKELIKSYYPTLIAKGYMTKDERPWVIAWRITISERTQVQSLLATAIPTDNETITPEGNRVYNDADALMVESTPGSRVQVYNINGRLEINQLSPNGTLRIPLSKSIYIVRIISDSGAQVYKVMKK